METRRSFLKKAGLLTGAAGMMQVLPASLQRALAINPAPGSTFYDAEHVVFLMQENRSFDHAFGTLQGVRGFNDPRAIQLPDGRPVWLQSNRENQVYPPFPLDIHQSRITWMGSLPHGWTDQVDARRNGHHDGWLDAKQPGDEAFRSMPLTMGYYSRKDIPFYYALADCFTICDQHFCSSLTGTTPNRLYFWSGTIREKMNAASMAHVWNGDADYGGGEVHWKTYPERLEENGVSWKVYQNEIYSDVGLGDNQPWLDNFGDNPLEYFPHYYVRMSPVYIAYLPKQINDHEKKLAAVKEELAITNIAEKKAELEKQQQSLLRRIKELKQEQLVFTKEAFDQLPAFSKQLFQKAFTTNEGDPDYHEVTSIRYKGPRGEQEMQLPKGDILYQFRKDVREGKLPTVSWLAAPAHFSDHPSSPWFGAWYISEVLDILTRNPEVWKKTIFVLTYDENDGYFDHVAPFAPPNPYQSNSGKTSAGIDTTVEYVRRAEQSSQRSNRESNIGLGYRVPMIIASPWSRGGRVCSEVFDHTSSLQFLEHFLEKKTGKKIIEENITTWRRTVCGDLRSVFRPYQGEKIQLPLFLEKEKFLASIYEAKAKQEPAIMKPLPANTRKIPAALQPQQEKGIREACPLPYELYADSTYDPVTGTIDIRMAAGREQFGDRSAGAPFMVQSLQPEMPDAASWRYYAVRAGDEVKDQWKISNENFHFNLHGPNGFYRSFRGTKQAPAIDLRCSYERKRGTNTITGNVLFRVRSLHNEVVQLVFYDRNHQRLIRELIVQPGTENQLIVALQSTHHWYDIQVTLKDQPTLFDQQFAGHVETGQVSKTDPRMGGVLPVTAL